MPLSDHAIRALSGVLAGGAAAIVTAPLDLAKTRLQVQKRTAGSKEGLRYSGLVGTLRTVVREEGVRGTFHGLGTTLLGLVPNWGVYFVSYGFFKDSLAQSGVFPEKSAWVHLLSAVGAGVVTAAATNPIWVVKVRLQTQPSGSGGARYTGIGHAFRTIYQEEGIRGFYKGLGVSLFGVTHVAIQFPLYEHVKHLFLERKRAAAHEAVVAPAPSLTLAPVVAAATATATGTLPATTLGGKELAASAKAANPTVLSPAELLVCTSLSKLVASSITYPHEVLRARFQRQRHSRHYQSIPGALRTIIREEGVGSLYQGLGANLVRVLPSAAVTFAVYEYTDDYLRRNYGHKKPRPPPSDLEEHEAHPHHRVAT